MHVLSSRSVTLFRLPFSTLNS